MSNLGLEVSKAFDSGEVFFGIIVLDCKEASSVFVLGMDVHSEVRQRFELLFTLIVVGQQFLQLIE